MQIFVCIFTGTYKEDRKRECRQKVEVREIYFFLIFDFLILVQLDESVTLTGAVPTTTTATSVLLVQETKRDDFCSSLWLSNFAGRGSRTEESEMHETPNYTKKKCPPTNKKKTI